jgi:hypothetical protein
LLAGCSNLNNPINSAATDQNLKEIALNQKEPAAGDQQNSETSKSAVPSATPSPFTSPSISPSAAPSLAPSAASNTPSASASSTLIVYKNTDYGFNFTLPEAWNGYSIESSQWEGLAIEGESGEKVVETGPIISIRDPQWTAQVPRQDIPIMVFTLDQWNSLEHDKFHIGADPVGPSELGRNNRYVFALPARYNFAFPEGYEEVEKIMESKPLEAAQLP